jgi:hypothetical protein
MPWARARSAAGSQSENARVTLGKQPASPMPKNRRMKNSDHSPQAQPVAAVKMDHITTTRVSDLRAPQRSAIQPPGISNRA